MEEDKTDRSDELMTALIQALDFFILFVAIGFLVMIYLVTEKDQFPFKELGSYFEFIGVLIGIYEGLFFVHLKDIVTLGESKLLEMKQKSLLNEEKLDYRVKAIEKRIKSRCKRQILYFKVIMSTTSLVEGIGSVFVCAVFSLIAYKGWLISIVFIFLGFLLQVLG